MECPVCFVEDCDKTRSACGHEICNSCFIKIREEGAARCPVCRSDFNENVRKNRLSAESGNTSAMFNMGLFYRKGLGVPINKGEALKWYMKSAEGGLVQAMFTLGNIYRRGSCGLYEDCEQAALWYLRAAEKGSIKAASNLGALYACRIGISEAERSLAVKWTLIAAESGSPAAMCNIAKMYKNGLYVEQNFDSALSWFRLAVENGYKNAMLELAQMYSEGLGVEKNDALAQELLAKANALP